MSRAEERYGGSGIGEFVPKVGEHTFWIIYRGTGDAWVPGKVSKCHRIDGPNAHSVHSVALSPYWSGRADDPQYQSHVIGGEAHENERDAVAMAIEWNEERIKEDEKTLQGKKAENEKLRERLRAL